MVYEILLWEDADLIEPLKKFVSRQTFALSDGINETKNVSAKNGCEGIGNKWERKCPTCDRVKTYTNKYNWLYAKRNNSRCKHCNGIGRTHTEETKEKIRQGNIGKMVSKETRKKIGNGNRGKQLSPESKKKVSLSLLGNKRRLGILHSEETKHRLSEVRVGIMVGELNPMYGKPSPTRGIPLSLERREKLRKFRLGETASEETRRKMREIHFRKKMESGGLYAAKHNPQAVQYFRAFDKENDFCGRYATNGGEYVVGNYFLDYYEPSLNIVIEWDEPHHYYVSGDLKPKDVFRMNFIKEQLGCDFYRINVQTGVMRKY